MRQSTKNNVLNIIRIPSLKEVIKEKNRNAPTAVTMKRTAVGSQFSSVTLADAAPKQSTSHHKSF